jgi:hypothetical protein
MPTWMIAARPPAHRLRDMAHLRHADESLFRRNRRLGSTYP